MADTGERKRSRLKELEDRLRAEAKHRKKELDKRDLTATLMGDPPPRVGNQKRTSYYEQAEDFHEVQD